MGHVKFLAEGDAEALRRMAGLEADEVASPLWIARKLLGADGVRDVRLTGRYATLARIGDRRVIAVNQRLPDPVYQWAIGHELGHWIRGSGHGEQGCEEQACHYVAAALLMPRAAFLGAYRRRGHDAASVHQLAVAFGVTDTSAALRIGETDGKPIAVVARGDAEWPEESAIRQWARRGAPSVTRSRLVDDRSRVVLAADAA